MAQESGSLSVSHARALRALSCGGMLTKDQIQHAASLDRLETRRVITNLSSRGMIMCRSYDKRWTITDLGRNAYATRPLESELALPVPGNER